MFRLLALAVFSLVSLAAVEVRAYEPLPVDSMTQPYDARLPHGVTIKLPEEGLDFLANQMENGLQGNTLRRAIVEALEGQYFEIVLPIFGGNLRLTIPCGASNKFIANDDLPDKNYHVERLWCPYVRGPAVIPGQVSLPPVTTQSDDGFRYHRVELEASTYPPAAITLPQPDSLFAALYLLEDAGKRTQLDMVPEHPLFKIFVPFPVTDPTTGFPKIPPEIGYTCFHLLGNGSGCDSAFVATLEADLVTGGQLRPFFDDNSLFVLVNQFNTVLNNLTIITPITQNTALLAALTACGEPCAAQREQVFLLYDTIEQALGDAALQFFERELNAALSGVLQDGINQLMFDRGKDGTPDPIVNLNTLASGLTSLSGKPFDFNFDSRYEASATDPVEAFLKLDGGIFAGGFDACVNPGASPAFHYTGFEADGNTGHDPPMLASLMPGLGLPYQLGLAFSDDFINQVVYNIWAAGLLCVTLSPDDPAMPPELADLLTTESFAPFVRWLPELAPKSQVSLQLLPVRAPYVSFGTGKKGGLLQIHLDEMQLDVFVRMGEGDKRDVRAFSLATSITAAVEVNAINLDAPPLLDLNVKFASDAAVAFNDLHPEHNEDLARMLPAVLDAMAPALADLVGSLEIPLLTNCIGGLRQRNLVVQSSGTDAETGINNYIELYLNFDGFIDFNKLVSDCMLALPSTAPKLQAPPFDLGLVTSNPAVVDLAQLGIDAAEPYRWRIDGGFWSPAQTGPWVPRLLLDGRHRIEFSQAGRVSGAAFKLDSAPPVLRFSQEGRTLRIEAIDSSAVSLRIGDGDWQDQPVAQIRLRDGRQAVRITARDAAGHEVSTEKNVVVRESRSGCAAGETPPWSLLLVVALLGFARRAQLRFLVNRIPSLKVPHVHS